MSREYGFICDVVLNRIIKKTRPRWRAELLKDSFDKSTKLSYIVLYESMYT